MGTINFTLTDFQESAHKWREEILQLPIITLRDKSLKYFTERPGIRYKESVGTLDGNVELVPYRANYTHSLSPDLVHRTLETFLGVCVEEFEPNATISTLLGKVGAAKGDGQLEQISAQAALSLIAKKVGEKLNKSLFNAVRAANGTTTASLFNGFDTITSTEITAGTIAAANGNYIQLSAAPTKSNCYDLIVEEVLYKLSEELRDQDCYLYCSQDILDKYNQAYKASTGLVPYNTQYDQQSVEGSSGRLIFAPLSGKAGSNFIHVAPKDNMLVGYDQMGDIESVEVERFAPFILTFIMTMFFGVEFESVDKSRLFVAQIP